MIQTMDLSASLQFMQIDFLVGQDIAQAPQRPGNRGTFLAKPLCYGRIRRATLVKSCRRAEGGKPKIFAPNRVTPWQHQTQPIPSVERLVGRSDVTWSRN